MWLDPLVGQSSWRLSLQKDAPFILLVMPNVIVRVIEPSEWQIYREIRLRALADSPDAFGSTWEKENAFSDQQWMARLSGVESDTDLPLFSEVDNRVGGLAWGRIEPSERTVAHIYQVWVAPEYRGNGSGKGLLKRIIDWAGLQGVQFVALTVTCGDSPARRLYDSLGFKPVGEVIPLRPGSPLLEQPMELEISQDSLT